MSEDEKQGELGATVMMDEGVDPLDAEFDGTVMLDDAGPTVAPDGTVMIGAEDNPASEEPGIRASPSGIEGRQSAPPPLPGGEDTSLPPNLDPTPAPPQASDMTFDRSKLDADETTDESPPPAASSSFFKPAAAAKAPAAPAPAPEPKPEKKPEPAKKPEPKKEAKKEPARKKPAPSQKKPAPAPPPPKPKGGIPAWAQLLGLVVVAGVIGHFIARSQGETTPAPVPQQTQAKPKPKPKAKPQAPKPTTTQAKSTVAPAPPAPTPSTAAPDPTPAPAPAPTKAADLSACVATQLGATFPSDKLTFVCEEPEANRAQRQMSTLFATIDPSERDARGEWNKMGWYRMAKLQIVRTRCCGDAPTLKIVEALSACGLDPALAAIAEADRNKSSYDEGVKAYGKAVDCLFKANTMRMFGIIARPGMPQRNAFVQSLTE